ncbi:MAG TPA: aminodeoxychorismate/anthranilate synthase component II [Phycisphaerae bacterium]|jgi:anthranilate synthase/aminodeoxychorismate synthase-like glutamine amidotransferase|nr:aminodeoxychorismate/anthranilate synthase component II [Phycisphaerae bacterium]HOB76262.1 aminodeoxychorismate/anthranilate synthase component II [Phycisphaerae bacterium]HOJ56246.1 aminodeoxychorismate/anthranilate synthase component II [Phycisphaerae bacterium]HOL27848.1 aminodeoxychorismate/anthranilate synthase component II [Phycisphaerae bacterium]HPP19670.1 aminodeoxychorismate/anthranilate synthase component II [Phycisphaerae bacterium]
MIVLIDNYDSFTYNLVQRIGELNRAIEIKVYRNDQVTLDQIESNRPTHIIISPGPCTPKEAGISVDVIKHFAGQVPILGVCLGHQSIGYAYGGEIVRAARLMHGKTSEIQHDGKKLFAGLSNPFVATRYHSLVIKPDTLHPDFVVTARTTDAPDDEIMGIRHKTLPIEGVQFHPESFLTAEGPKLLANFLKM